MTEAELQDEILIAAAELGVLAFHSGDTRRNPGNHGFPDLVLVGERVEFWELKSATGRLSDAQWEWARRLKAASTIRVIRPDLWPDEIYRLLRAIRGK